MIRLVSVLLFTLISMNVYAVSSYTGTIKSVVCHVEFTSDICQVRVNGTVENETCSADLAWKYNFDGSNPHGKNILSILLAAQMSGKSVVIGSQGCPNTSGPEDLRHVYIVTP